MQSSTSRVDIKLTLAVLIAIRGTAIKSAGERVSTMESLVAYLVTVLNRVEDVPIRRIFNVVEVSNVVRLCTVG
jgi:hypothetical protein